MKKRLLAMMMVTVALSSSMTAFAAPKTMKDGTVFDADYYAQQNPDVVAVYGTNSNALYRHYTAHGKAEGRMSHMNDTSHIAAPVDGTFDAAYYAQQNPDVVAVYGTNSNALYSHYVTHGKAEGRKSHVNDMSHLAVMNTTSATSVAPAAPTASTSTAPATFDASYYAQKNPDVVAVYGTDSKALYSHYTTHGRSEGRMGHE